VEIYVFSLEDACGDRLGECQGGVMATAVAEAESLVGLRYTWCSCFVIASALFLDDVGCDKGGNSACSARVKDGTTWVVYHVHVIVVVGGG